MMIVPLNPVPNQTELINIGSPTIIQCQLNVYQKNVGMFLDLYIEGNLTLSSILCRNLTPLIINSYFGFPGELVFVDTLLNLDPIYTGLGTRWFLVYITAADAAQYSLNPVFA
jgi:hypothetical protein